MYTLTELNFLTVKKKYRNIIIPYRDHRPNIFLDIMSDYVIKNFHSLYYYFFFLNINLVSYYIYLKFLSLYLLRVYPEKYAANDHVGKF